MKLFLTIQMVTCLLASLLVAQFSDRNSAASFAIGGLLVAFNVGVLAFVWFHIIQKKLIALSLAIIVFKYAILAFIIYKLLGFSWIQKGYLSAGLGSLVVTVLIYGIIIHNKDAQDV